MLVGTAVIVLVTTMASQVTVLSRRSMNNIASDQDTSSQGKVALSKMREDITDGDMALAKFPYTGAASFTSANNDTVIIRTPQYDSNHDPIDGAYNAIIYKKEAATGDDAPAVIKRYVGTINIGPSSTTFYVPTTGSKLIGKVTSFYATWSTSETFYGNAWQDYFYLVTTPAASDSHFTNRAIIGGTDRFGTGEATLTYNMVQLNKIPNWSVPIDFVYQVAPGVQANPQGGNFATRIKLELKVNNQQQREDNSKVTRSVKLETSAELSNH